MSSSPGRNRPAIPNAPSNRSPPISSPPDAISEAPTTSVSFDNIPAPSSSPSAAGTAVFAASAPVSPVLAASASAGWDAGVLSGFGDAALIASWSVCGGLGCPFTLISCSERLCPKELSS